MKSRVESWIQYPTNIVYLFYVAHVFFLQRLSVFLESDRPSEYYQWPVRIILESFNNQSSGKWLIVLFCVITYFLSIFYGRKRIVQCLVVVTNLFYLAMSSFPALAINSNESFCFLYFSIAILFFNLSGKFFVDKYKVLIALAVSPYVLSGIVKVYHYKNLLTDITLFNRIIELEYFSHRTSFLIPFLKGHEFTTYPLFPLAILLQILALFTINSLRFRKIWLPAILFFHLFNSILFKIDFFFAFIILPFVFLNSKDDLEEKDNSLLVSIFYFLLIFTTQNLYRLTTLPLSGGQITFFRIYSIFYFVITFAAMFLYKKNFIKALGLLFLLLNATFFLIYNIPFSFPDYVILIVIATTFLKNLKVSLAEIKQYLTNAMIFIGGMRVILLVLYAFNISWEKIPYAFRLMVELPRPGQLGPFVFLLIAIIEIFYHKIHFQKWALPLLIVTHLYLACFFYITSSYYLFWIISIIALNNLKDSNTPNKWTIATSEI